MLATKITFANEIGNFCKKLGIDSYEVMDIVGMDSRIERKFLNPGLGFGGSCFPKDVAALVAHSKELGHEAKVFRWPPDQKEQVQRQSCQPLNRLSPSCATIEQHRNQPEYLKPEEKPYFHQLSQDCIEKSF